MIDKSFVQKCQAFIEPNRFRLDEPMKLHTTFKIGGPADCLIFPASMEEDPYYQTYFDALKALCYQGGISMEGFPESRESFPREAAETCRFLRAASR